MFASPWKDAVIVLVIVLLFFGPKRLPALSRAIGESVKEFKGGIGQGGASEEKSELPSSSTPEAGVVGTTPEQARTSSATSEHTSA
jgi:sec-independent protein translocase protein TatA